jgi:hypothetical protein
LFLDVADMSMIMKNFNNGITDMASLKLYIRKLIHKNLSMAEISTAYRCHHNGRHLVSNVQYQIPNAFQN